MSFLVTITLNNITPGCGPFDIYTDADAYTTALQTNVPLGALLSPGLSINVPTATTTVKVVPLGICTDPIYLSVSCALPTTTTSTTTTSTTTSTTSTTSTTTTTTSAPPTTTTTTTSTSTTTTSTTTSTTSTTSTTTTTTDPCYVLVNSSANVYKYEVLTNTTTPLVVPNVGASPDIAHTQNKMWLINLNKGSFVEWNITNYPTWNATYVGDKYWPAGFKSSNGLWAIDDTTLLTVNTDYVGGSPLVHKVCTYDLVTNSYSEIFSIADNNIVSGDFMLTSNNKFIVSTYDTITGSVYVYQYDYPAGTLDVQLDVTGVLSFPFGIFQAHGKIYLVNRDTVGSVYWLQNWPPYTLVTTPVGSVGVPVDGASQLPDACAPTYLGTTSTTTTTTSTTTTSTTTSTTSTTSTTTTTTRPPAICHTLTASGGR